MTTKTATTTPPDFHEQAQELVLNWKANDFISSLNMREDKLIESVVSFAAEAATQGQVQGIERARLRLVELADAQRDFGAKHNLNKAEVLASASLAVHQLSPLPDYLDQVRNGAGA